MEQNYLSPFNPTAQSKSYSPESGHVSLKVYDLPKEIKTRIVFGTFSRLPEYGEMRRYMLERFRSGYKPGDSKIEFQYIDKYMVGIEKIFATYVLLNFNYFYKDMRNLIPIQRLSDGSLLYDVKNRASSLSRGFNVNTKSVIPFFPQVGLAYEF